MQTFLPYKDFNKSAEVLDYRRLGKQRVEAWQILNVLTGNGKRNKNGKMAWENHPAVKMWKGYERALAVYGYIICLEWLGRGYKDTLMSKFGHYLYVKGIEDYFLLHLDKKETLICYPPWLGDDEFHKSHQSNLLRKDNNYYSQFGWQVSNDLPYIWPTRE